MRASFKTGLLAFLALFALGYFMLGHLASYTLVSVDLSNSHSSKFKLYWITDNNHAWSEKNAAAVYVNSRKKHHRLLLPVEAGKIRGLRIDPTDRKGVKSVIRSIDLYSVGRTPVSIDSRKEFSRLKANDEVDELSVSKSSINLTAIGDDPYLVAEISPGQPYPAFFSRAVPAMVLGLVGVMLIIMLPGLSRELRFVPGAMLLAGVLVTAMASLTRDNAHPDESVHIKVAQYYQHHYSPPVVCSRESLFTYSIYGVSRLNKREIAYYLGGRYLQMVSAVPANDYLKLRFLNVAMFAVLVLLAFVKPMFRYIALPLLLTPQAWYLFGYYNSDALSLFGVCLFAWQLFDSNSVLRKIFHGEHVRLAALAAVSLALLFALQLWLKINFMFYHFFVVMLAVSWLLARRSIPRPASLVTLSVSVILGMSLFMGWEGWRRGVNDFQLAEKFAQCQELTAGEIYKPSTPLEHTHPTLRLRDKGVSLLTMLEKYNWTQRIFYTALGAYGYTEYLSVNRHYEIVSGFILLLFMYVSMTVIIRGNGFDRLSVLSALAAMAALVVAAAGTSWINDMQAQGRYLLVFLPIFGSLLLLHRQRLNLLVVTSLSLVPFILALASFILIGLLELPGR